MESKSFPFSEKYSSYMFSAGRKRLLSVSSLVIVSSFLLILALIFQYFSFNISVLQPLFHSSRSTTTTTSSNHTDIKNVSDDDVGKTHEEIFSNGSKNASLLSSYIGQKDQSVDGKTLGQSSVGDIKNDSSSGETQQQPPQCSISENSNADVYEKCDIYKGKWVRDEKKPYYPVGSCPHIDKGFNCHANGRPDDDFLKWRWQPDDCNIPSFNATDFLERSRGKNITFVGDSQNRNMWKSLVCMLRHGVANTTRVHKIYGKNYFIGFIYEDYNCYVQYVSAPFLVRETSVKLENGTSPTETLRLDLMHKKAEAFNEADVIVFNTGQWWNYDKTSKGENYYQEGTYLYPKLEVLKAFHKALITWGKWVDENVNTSRTQVIFRGYSFTHFRDGQWSSGGQCHKETEPNFNDTSLRKYPTKMKIVENVLKQMKTPVIYMNVSRLTDYRQDGHPSIYRMEYKTEEEWAAAMHSQDCSHWCLPGVPDTWNELMYASLLKFGKGPWTN